MLSVLCGLVLVLTSPEARGECPAFLPFSPASSLILAFPLPILPEPGLGTPGSAFCSILLGEVCEQSVIVPHFLPLIPFRALPHFPVVLPHVPEAAAGAWLVWPAAQSSLCAHSAPAWATWEELWLLEALSST